MARILLRWRVPLFVCALILFRAELGFCQKREALPDAPPAHSSVAFEQQARYFESKWFGVVDPGEKVPPLYTRDKMMFWLHEEVEPTSLYPGIYLGGMGEPGGWRSQVRDGFRGIRGEAGGRGASAGQLSLLLRQPAADADA